MRTISIFIAGFFLTVLPVAAADACCATEKCCASEKCCAHATVTTAVPPAVTYLADRIVEPSPAREYAKVHFTSPVRIGENVLMGEYIIEHDTDRMGRGGPCTHIYAAKDRSKPVVAFHCRHLLRAVNASEKAKVTLRRDYNAVGTAYILTEFQYAGEREAHGVPGVRGVPAVR
jgi:hypothetical protein